MAHVNRNPAGKALGQVWLTREEFDELVRLIDDDPVDETILAGIRRKLVSKRRRVEDTPN